MAYSTPYSFTGSTTLDPAKLDSNFSALASKLNAGLTEANMSSATRFSNTFLTNKHYNFVVTLEIDSTGYAATGGNTFLDYHGFGDSGSTDVYTVVGYDWVCTDVGDQIGNFAINWIEWTAGSTSTITSILGTTTMVAQSGVANTAGVGSGVLGVDITLSASKPRYFQLIQAGTKGTGLLSAAYDKISVTLYLKRKNGLRA